jgi:tetratricopeptide (TPR) repeat protein
MADTERPDLYRDLYREGKFAEALTALEKTPDAAQGTYSYYFNRGIIHHALGQDALAVAYLEKANVLNPGSKELAAPLAEARANLAKFLGAGRLDVGSNPFESLGESLPIEPAFAVTGALALALWIAWLVPRWRRSGIQKSAVIALLLAVAFGAWSLWLDNHPQWITTQARMVKSGPGESFLDRGPIEAGMKLRVEGVAHSEDRLAPSLGPGGKPVKWYRVRFNDALDSGYLPEQSGLLLTDESSTPES